MFRPPRVFVLALCLFPFTAAFATSPLLLRDPSISKDHVAFVYAGDIWTAPRDGGEAIRLTSEGTITSGPYFSPDGTRIAYSARIAGAEDVYVIDANGGVPKRLTWNPMGNSAVGWTPDGKSVLFASFRTSYSDFPKLYTVRADGSGIPTLLPLPSGVEGSYSPDGGSHRLRSGHAMGGRLEALSRRPDHAYLAHRPQDPRPRQSPTRELQRQ